MAKKKPSSKAGSTSETTTPPSTPKKVALEFKDTRPPLANEILRTGSRLVLLVGAMYLWFFTQKLIGSRLNPETNPDQKIEMSDGIHNAVKPITDFLRANVKYTDFLLVSSSVLIDFVGLFMCAYSIFGASVRPFIAFLSLFMMRQVMQLVCVLPPPEGMIWYYPGVPSLFVTYGVSNDMFFSGHTGIAVLGAIELTRFSHKMPAVALLGLFIALYEISTVLVLRAHYTMDVFTGAVVAAYCSSFSRRISPAIDEFLNNLFTKAVDKATHHKTEHLN